ncbi:MAG: PAC2 family protein [Corynebacterium sp.]|nr:PAC2 family protein [Corynebacterium sp.]
MQEQNRPMYEMEYPAPAVNQRPTLVVALEGYADAGFAVESSANHLKAALESRPLATFNTDELIDYRSRRPAATLETDSTVEMESMDLDIRVMKDISDKPFLLLSGPEPDLRWKAFTQAVTDLVKRFDVENTICLYAAPMPVPHTRPMVVTAHGNSKDLIGHMVHMDQKLIVPGSAQLMLEKVLAQAGRNVAGYTAHVPHYLASSSYPQATFELLDAIASAVGLDLPLKVLEKDMERVNNQVTEQVSDSEEVLGVVHALEQQYDAYIERYRQEHPQAIMPGEKDVPSGEEIGAEFQQFLAKLGTVDDFLAEDIDDAEDNSGTIEDDS